MERVIHLYFLTRSPLAVHTHISTCTQYTRRYTHRCTHIHKRAHLHTRAHRGTCAHMHIHTGHTCVHTNMHTGMGTHTHTCTQAQGPVSGRGAQCCVPMWWWDGSVREAHSGCCWLFPAISRLLRFLAPGIRPWVSE